MAKLSYIDDISKPARRAGRPKSLTVSKRATVKKRTSVKPEKVATEKMSNEDKLKAEVEKYRKSSHIWNKLYTMAQTELLEYQQAKMPRRLIYVLNGRIGGKKGL